MKTRGRRQLPVGKPDGAQGEHLRESWPLTLGHCGRVWEAEHRAPLFRPGRSGSVKCLTSVQTPGRHQVLRIQKKERMFLLSTYRAQDEIGDMGSL